uniref:Transmembrane protein 241 n=1 Tax=Sphenodon punctatus TaxID=8508 RepID=A0A8D0LAL4_SPHPU
MYLKRPAVGLSFCLFYLASYFTNKYVLSVLKFTYPTLFQGWQTLIGGFLLHISWKLGWVEISSSPRSEVLSWLPASALFVGIIYAGSRALSRLFDPDGYFWALIHLLCIGKVRQLHHLIAFPLLIVTLAIFASFPLSILLCSSGDLFSALDFPFLYFYRFHSSCCASGILGFLLMLHTVKLKSSMSPGQYAAWSVFPPPRVTTIGLNSQLSIFPRLSSAPCHRL